jgi:peroxiredoxin
MLSVLDCQFDIPDQSPPKESPDITFQLTGASNSKVYLIGFYQAQQFIVDSALTDVAGRGQLKRDEPYESGFYTLQGPGTPIIQLLIDQDQTFHIETGLDFPQRFAEVTGSLDNELLQQNLAYEQDFKEKLQRLTFQMRDLPEGSAEYNSLLEDRDQLLAERKADLEALFEEHPYSFFTQYKKAGQNPEVEDLRLPDGSVDRQKQVALYKKAFWESVDFEDERLLRTPVIANKLRNYITELTPQNADSILAAAHYLIDQVPPESGYVEFFANWIPSQYRPGQTSLMDGEKVFVRMVEEYFTYDKAFWADSMTLYALQERASQMAQSLIGQKGPDVVSTDPNGNTKSIYEITAPYVVIFMYNPECDHCQEEAPELVEFYREWKPKGVEVFAIALDTDPEKWKAFIQENKMDFINVFDPTNASIYAKYYVDNTPEIYVLNPDRTIIGKNLKTFQIETVIERDRQR